MMKWLKLLEMPTSIIYATPSGVHESCYRSYHLVEKIRDYAERGVPNDVLVELIDEFHKVPLEMKHELD